MKNPLSEKSRDFAHAVRGGVLVSIWAVAILTLAVFGGSIAWTSYDEYQETLAREYRLLENHARFGDAQIAGALRSLDLLLQNVVDDRLSSPPLPESLVERRQLSLLRQFPEIHFLITTDKAGQVVTAESIDDAESIASVRKFDASQREYFAVHRDAAPSEYHRYSISRPFKTITDRVTITISRAIRAADGRFEGVALVSLSPEYFDRVLRDVLPDDGMSTATLLNNLGDVIRRLPASEDDAGTSIASSATFKAFLRSGLRLTAERALGTPDRINRIMVYSRIDDTTLSIGVSSKTNAVLAKWRHTLLVRVLGFCLTATLTLLLAWYIQRRILERGRADERERQLLGKFAAVFEISPEAIAITRLKDGVVVEANDTACAQIGLNRADAIGKSLMELRVAAAPGDTKQLFAELRVAGRVTNHASVLYRRDGTLMDVLLSAAMLEIDGVKCVLWSWRDVTESIKAAEEIKKLSVELQTLFDVSVVAIAFLVDRKIMRCNLEFARMFGYERSEITGMSMETLHPTMEMSDERAARVYGLLATAGTYSSETQMKRKDGSQFHCLFTLRAVDRADLSKGFVWASMDTTARHLAEAEVRKLAEELEARVKTRTAELEVANKKLLTANQELETFSYSVSHDLRGPVRSIAGFSALLLSDHGDSLPQTVKNYLKRISASAHRMGEMIDGLLTLARVSRMELHETRVDLSDMARSVATELQLLATNRNVEFSIQEGMAERGDARLFQIVLDNLLGNAWKYTSKREQANIDFGRYKDSHGATVYFVRDNGAGFDMEHAGKLFEPFERLHNVSEFEGSGIGLATAYRVIGRHHGKIWAEAKPGEGATFHFTLG